MPYPKRYYSDTVVLITKSAICARERYLTRKPVIYLDDTIDLLAPSPTRSSQAPPTLHKFVTIFPSLASYSYSAQFISRSASVPHFLCLQQL